MDMENSQGKKEEIVLTVIFAVIVGAGISRVLVIALE
jgi:hypothetical protein